MSSTETIIAAILYFGGALIIKLISNGIYLNNYNVNGSKYDLVNKFENSVVTNERFLYDYLSVANSTIEIYQNLNNEWHLAFKELAVSGSSLQLNNLKDIIDKIYSV